MAFVCPWWRPTGGGALSSYKNRERDLNYLALAYGKMIYASAGGLHSIWGKNVIDQDGTEIEEDLEDVDPEAEFTDAVSGSIEVSDDASSGDTGIIGPPAPIAGTTKARKTSKIKTRGVYSEGDYGDDGITPKFYPKPHLVSISTSGMDSLGLNQKGSYSYKTYAGWQGFEPPAIGTKGAGMSWGWAYGGKVINGAGFSGDVVGWSATANMEGGYDVTVDLLGSNASVNAASMGADASTVEFDGGSESADALGNKIANTGIFSKISSLDSEAETAAAANPSFSFPLAGVSGCIIEIPDDFTTEKTGTPPPPLTEGAAKKYKGFIKFTDLVALCNIVMGAFTDGVKFVCDDPASASAIDVPSGLQSGNPLELLVEGTNPYGPLNLAAGSGKFTGKLTELYVGSEWAKKLTDQIKITQSNTEGGVRNSISFKSFFDTLFSMINENLGNLYSLTLANSATKGDKNIYIVDYNRIDKGVSAHNVGVARSATCTAKLDGDQAAMFYTIKNAPAGVATPPPAKKNESATPSSKYPTALEALGTSGAIAANIAAIRSINKALVAEKIAGSSAYGVAAPFDLSVTTDGSSGYVYGGVITHDSVPASPVAGYKVGFAITNIQHSVSAGDWTTSLSTYCRLYR